VLFYSAIAPMMTFATATPPVKQEINRENLLLLLSGEWVSRALYVANKLEVAEHLLQEPKSIDELAKLTQANPESLYRLLHMLSSYQVFEEVSPRVFANTGTSMLLAKSHPDTLHALSLFYGEDIHRAWDEFLPAVQTGNPAFQLAFKRPVFRYFKENPMRGALFQEAMKEKSMAVIKSTLEAFDFSKFTSVYDLGGGHGQLMQAVVHKHPHLNGAILDLPEVISTVRARTPQLEQQKCRLISGNFFESVPKGGDLYLLKSVLHDWDDERCETILSNCHRAMTTDSRLLIIEVVLQTKALYANCMDMLMLACTGGKERELTSFQQMFERTGFVLERIYPTATEFSILEVRKK